MRDDSGTLEFKAELDFFQPLFPHRMAQPCFVLGVKHEKGLGPRRQSACRRTHRRRERSDTNDRSVHLSWTGFELSYATPLCDIPVLVRRPDHISLARLFFLSSTCKTGPPFGCKRSVKVSSASGVSAGAEL